MGDLVTCTAVLFTSKGREHLLLSGRGHAYLSIPVRPHHTPKTETPEWEYYHVGDVLHIEPSLLVTSDPEPQFHTDFHWTTRFVRLPEDSPRNEDVLTYFDELNGRR